MTKKIFIFLIMVNILHNYFVRSKRKQAFVFSSLVIIIILIAFFGIFREAKAGSEHSVYGWAWVGGGVYPGVSPVDVAHIGWISFNCDNPELPLPRCTIDYGAHICTSETDPLCSTVSSPKTGKLIGYAWAGGGRNADGSLAPTIGWIRLDPPGPYPALPDYSACVNLPGVSGETCEGDLAENEIGGWARACAAADDPLTCSGVTNPNSGGWDGWIKLRGTIQPYGVWLDKTPPPPDEFREWAWGGDNPIEKSVIGWVNFNCFDTPAGCGTSYKVIIQNNAPSANNLNKTEGNYCSASSPPIFLNWTFDDPGDTQSAYRVEIATDSSFVNIINRSCDPPPLDDPQCKSSTAGPGPYSYAPLDLSFGIRYWWRLKVWDSGGAESSWINYNDPLDSDGDGNPATFTTDSEWPRPDFTVCPSNPVINQPAQFCSVFEAGVCEIGICPVTGPISWTTCEAGCSTWAWDFGDSAGSSPQQNPTYSYSNAPTSPVRLTVTDTLGHPCSKTHDIGVATLSVPIWKEIPPF